MYLQNINIILQYPLLANVHDSGIYIATLRQLKPLVREILWSWLNTEKVNSDLFHETDIIPSPRCQTHVI